MTAEEIIMSVCKVKNKIDCTEKLEKEKTDDIFQYNKL